MFDGMWFTLNNNSLGVKYLFKGEVVLSSLF